MKRSILPISMLLAACAAAASPTQQASSPSPAGSLSRPAFETSSNSTGPTASASASASASTTGPSGPLTKEAIRQVIRSWNAEIKGCYERQFQRDSKLKGQVIARFMIGESGKVASVDMSSSTIKAPQVVDCVGKLFSLMEFPKPENGMVLITYPIDFDWEESSR